MFAPARTRAEPVRWRGDWCAAAVFVVIWATTLIPPLLAATANTRLVEAFSTDEAMLTNLLARALDHHSWEIRFGAYGHLYLNMALLPLKYLWPTTARAIVITARTLSLIAAAGLLLSTFAWARRMNGTLAAWLAMILVALNPTIYTWAMVVHPDMLQAFCLLVALFYTVSVFDWPTTARIVAAASFAGLAFAAKYSGLFVLPLIAGALIRRRAVTAGPRAEMRISVMRAMTSVAAVVVLFGGLAIDGPWIVTHVTADGHVDVPLPITLDALVWVIRGFGALLAVVAATPWTWKMLRRWAGAETVPWGFGVALAAFTIVFVATSSYSLVKLAFLKGLYFEAVETGAALNIHWVAYWTRAVFTTVGLPIVLALAGTGLGWLADRRQHVSLEIVLWSWNILYILVLLAPVHDLSSHYALPLVAPAALLGACGMVTALDVVAWRFPRVPRTVAATLAMTTVVCFELANVAILSQMRQSALQREQQPKAVAGEWLTDHVPVTSRIVYDYESYVPPAFTNVTGSWGASAAWLSTIDPDVVVVNRDVSSGWHGPRDEQSYVFCLEGGTCGYRRIFVLEPIAIFQRRDAP